MTTLQAAIDARGAAVGARQFEQSAGRIQRSARDIDGSVSRADRSVEGFGRSAVRSLGGIASAAAATAVAIQGIRVVAGFEEGLVTLGGVARATDEEFARLAAAEVPQLAGDTPDPVGQPHDFTEIRRRLLAFSRCDQLLAALGEDAKRRDRLADFVVHTRRDLAKRCQPVGLRKLFAQGPGSLGDYRFLSQLPPPADQQKCHCQCGNQAKQQDGSEPTGRDGGCHARPWVDDQVQIPADRCDALLRFDQRHLHHATGLC